MTDAILNTVAPPLVNIIASFRILVCWEHMASGLGLQLFLPGYLISAMARKRILFKNIIRRTEVSNPGPLGVRHHTTHRVFPKQNVAIIRESIRKDHGYCSDDQSTQSGFSNECVQVKHFEGTCTSYYYSHLLTILSLITLIAYHV